jgi:NMD protein affecting ribosome stability and mRNA decay
MTRNDSVLCPGCGREFSMPLVEMVRRQHRWCDQCIELADKRLQEAIDRVVATQVSTDT